MTHGYWELELDSWDGTYNEFYKVMDTNEYRPGTYDSCIADGWSSTADRYVWGSCYGTWNYVSVIVY